MQQRRPYSSMGRFLSFYFAISAFFPLVLGISLPDAAAQEGDPRGAKNGADTLRRASIVTARSLNPDAVRILLRAVDISRFPDVSVILDARDKDDRHYTGLKKTDLLIYHNGKRYPVLALENISSRNSVPVDIVFVIDQTGSMRRYVEEVKSNVEEFTHQLAAKGIDYRLGLITFSDVVEQRKNFTANVREFIEWIDGLRVGGGGDTNENALEGVDAATRLSFRSTAQKILILISDAMFHQKGDHGDGTTEWTTETIGDYVLRKNIQLYAVAPPTIEDYDRIARKTHGQTFAIMQSFSSILTGFSNTLTSLYAVRYRLSETTPPESADIEIRNSEDQVILKEQVQLLAVDKKFIVDNILFDFDKASLNQNFIPQLNHILAMLKAYATIEIEIQGHTDDIGSDEYNISLSEARAIAVRRYLIANGIAPERLRTRGLGKGYPIAPNDTEEGRQLNRRTEIVITKK